MKTISILSLSLVFLFACKTAEKTTVTNPDDPKNETQVAENDSIRHTTKVAADDSLFASIYRSVCYGTCPNYKLQIYQNGTVMLEGIRFMEPIGKFKSTLTEEQKQLFIDKALEIEYLQMNDRYDGSITDIPSATTNIVVDGYRKEVYRRFNYPQRILQFEQLFDELLKSLEWTAIEE